ncbi:DUF6571 family protein [Nonomuraea sp. NPDC050643]|uniref:DUF6571 family protein n=1 Tax=Nonomuraea sp. NPDC050643 TaxID=3155660 RepID=UPI0033C79536
MSEPSPTPQVSPTPPPADWAYSGIDPTAMAAFESALARAETTLGGHEARVRRLLQHLGLDTSGLLALHRTRHWLTAKRPELRRRNETIQAVRTEWGATPETNGALVAFDENLYNRASDNPEAYAAAVRLMEPGDPDDRALAALERHIGDPAFDTLLMHALGAANLRTVLTRAAENDTTENRRLLTALGKALGTASPHLDATWRAAFTGDLSRDRGYGISLALSHGTFDAAFLVEVARRIDAEDRRPPAEGGRVFVNYHRDPLVGVMMALSRHPEAAQDFLAGDPGALKRFMTERTTLDHQVFGKVLEAATLHFRDREGTPEQPSRGYSSARLAAQFMQLEAQRLREGRPTVPFVPSRTTGLILAHYIADVSRAAFQENTDASLVYGQDRPSVPGRDPWGAKFNVNDLRLVMIELFGKDAKSFGAVLAAQTSWANILVNEGADQMVGGKGEAALMTSAQEVGAGFGLLTDAASIGTLKEGAERDEAQERNMKTFMAVINTSLAIPQAGAWPIGAGVVGAWTGLIEDSAKTDLNKNKAAFEANTSVAKAGFMVNQLVIQAMLRREMFGESDPPARTHPWSSLDGLKAGEDPRESPNNFLHDDGKTLMTLDEMAPENAEYQPRIDAYRRWHEEGFAGGSWKAIKERLDEGFGRGFATYTPSS